MKFEFRPLTPRDVPLLHEWTKRPHVSEWDIEAEDDYFPVNDPRDFKPYIAYIDDRPVAYVQSYVAIDAGDGWWSDQHDPSVLGMDVYIGSEDDLGRGIGTELVKHFVAFLFTDRHITRIQIDPSPENARGIRCYEKAGFQRVGTVDTPDGPALLMHLNR